MLPSTSEVRRSWYFLKLIFAVLIVARETVNRTITEKHTCPLASVSLALATVF